MGRGAPSDFRLMSASSTPKRYDKNMLALHITETELARDLAGVMEKVRQGAEVVVEQGYRTVAVIRPVKGPGRSIDKCIAMAKAHGSGATVDEDFAKDLEEVIAGRQPLDTSAWD